MSQLFQDLPAGWRLTRVDRVADVNARIGWKALTANEYQPEGFAFLSTPNIKGSEIDFDRVNYISEWRYEESPELKLRVGDVLLAKDGNTLGITNVVRELPRPATVNGSIAVLRPRTIDSDFLRYVLTSQAIQGLIEAFKAGMGVPHLFQWDINRLPIPVPPAREQRLIADFLDRETARIDTLIAKKRRMIELLDVRTEAQLADLLDPIVADCGEQPVKTVAEVRVSNVDKKSYDGELPVELCNYTDVYYHRTIDGSLSFMRATADAAQVRRLTLRRGDVLITKDSETADDIAVPALVRQDLPGVVLGYHLAMYRPRDIDGEFLYWVLRSRKCRDAFALAASGVTRYGLRQDSMGALPVPTPDRPIQEDVVSRIELSVGTAERGRKALSAQIELLREHRQALITAAVTGELEVPGVAA